MQASTTAGSEGLRCTTKAATNCRYPSCFRRCPSTTLDGPSIGSDLAPRGMSTSASGGSGSARAGLVCQARRGARAGSDHLPLGSTGRSAPRPRCARFRARRPCPRWRGRGHRRAWNLVSPTNRNGPKSPRARSQCTPMPELRGPSADLSHSSAALSRRQERPRVFGQLPQLHLGRCSKRQCQNRAPIQGPAAIHEAPGARRCRHPWQPTHAPPPLAEGSTVRLEPRKA
mmetsp:Transcript_92195/g.298198  ORF Transcript_92195/g.298198 Transcript_92195/m.298198 type:complete len:229 (-) Transcript_92195:2-688(-)